MIKAVFSDFDGTLVDRGKNFNPRTRELIHKLLEKNIRFSIATGRCFPGIIEKKLKELDIKGVHIVHNGGVIYDSEKPEPIVWSEPISRESLTKILKILESRKIGFAIEAIDCSYMTPYDPNIEYFQNAVIRELKYFDIKTDIYKMLIFAKINTFTEEQIDGLKKELQDTAKDIEIIKFIYDGHFGADLNSEKATKHTAVLEYCRIYGIKKEETVAIGDWLNDYPLFTASGYKIAMGNANPELKEIADIVVPPVTENGFDAALEHILSELV